MAKTELFWLGEGVFSIDGEEYDISKPLPVDKIGKDDLAKMKKDGRIGEKIAVVNDGDKALKVLQEKIETLESAECEKCAVIQEELDAANEKVTDLEGQLEEASKVPSKKELKDAQSKVTELEKLLEDATKE